MRLDMGARCIQNRGVTSARWGMKIGTCGRLMAHDSESVAWPEIAQSF